MPVFLQFRMWLASGPPRERILAGAAIACAVALLVLASLPLTDGGNPTTSIAASGAPGTGPPAGTAPAASGAGVAPTGEATPTGAAPAGTPAADGAAVPTGEATAAYPCAGLSASAPGITESEVVIGVSLVDLAGPVGNAAFNIRPDLEDAVNAIVAEINSTGGVACGRQLVARMYRVNPIDTNDQQAECLQMVEDGVFVVLDLAGYARPAGRACFVQNQLPHQISTSGTDADISAGFPYLYGENATSEKMVRDGILGLSELGFFAAPAFQRLGLLVDQCDPPVVAQIEASLAEVGVSPDQVSTFTMSCQLVGSPVEQQQAVLQHQRDGVTHVFLASSLTNSQRYTQFAADQGFRPFYGVSDYGTLTSSASPFDETFVGAIGITSTLRGELNSGVRNAQLEECHRILTSRGVAGIETERDDGAAALACDQLTFFRQAINAAGANPTREQYVEQGVGLMGERLSASGSNGIFDRAGKVTGGDFHRALTYDGGCQCWRLRDPEFRPGF